MEQICFYPATFLKCQSCPAMWVTSSWSVHHNAAIFNTRVFYSVRQRDPKNRQYDGGPPMFMRSFLWYSVLSHCTCITCTTVVPKWAQWVRCCLVSLDPWILQVYQQVCPSLPLSIVSKRYDLSSFWQKSTMMVPMVIRHNTLCPRPHRQGVQL